MDDKIYKCGQCNVPKKFEGAYAGKWICPNCREDNQMLENETQLEDAHIVEPFGDEADLVRVELHHAQMQESITPKREALRYDTGKPEMMYLMTFPNAIREFTKVCTYGGNKYDVGNYLKGAKYTQYVNCGLRHLFAWWGGEERDPESKCLHLAHFVWNALCLCEMAITRKDLDDRFTPSSVQEREED